MAATLTSITREPYDAQHVPFTTVKFVKKDTAFQFDVQVPRDADVMKPARPATTDSQGATKVGGQDEPATPKLGCRYLLGQAPDNVDIVELNKEKEQTGDKKPR